MSANPSRGPLLDHLDQIEEISKDKNPKLRELIHIFGNDGHYLVIFFLILPFLQPIPMLGLSTPFGLMIAIVGAFAYLRKPPVIPARWAEKTVSGKTVLQIAEGSERIFEKLSWLIHPRYKFMFREPFRTVSVILIIINSVLLALPLPIPFSNTIPAWMILLHALGQLEDDGALIILSYMVSIFCWIFFAAIYFGVAGGINYIKWGL
jgi:hypothetical protein